MERDRKRIIPHSTVRPNYILTGQKARQQFTISKLEKNKKL